MKKITLYSESPFTIDFIHELKTNFRATVTDKLDERSKNAILTQQDPATMTDSEVVTLRNTISRFIYGNVLDFCQLPVFGSLIHILFCGFFDGFLVGFLDGFLVGFLDCFLQCCGSGSGIRDWVPF